MPGVFLVVEGPDGAGKSTLVKHLAARLTEAGVAVLQVREPGGTPLAERARRAALAPELEASPLAELFLILAARADLVAKVIRPALAAGASVVLSDRFDLSTEAYQIAGRGLPREAVLAANQLATGGLKPDLTLVLDLPAEAGLARVARGRAGRGRGRDRIEGEDVTMHRRVAAAFAGARGPGIVHLDAGRPADEVAEAAWKQVDEVLRKLIPVRRG